MYQFFVLLILVACSTSTEKINFQNEKPLTSQLQADEKESEVIKQYEVKQIVEATEVKPLPPKEKRKKLTQPKPVPTTVVSPSVPVDYPAEMTEISKSSKETWSLYQPRHLPGQKIILEIDYLGLTVGRMMIENKGQKQIGDKKVWHFSSRFKSAPFYSNIYQIDDLVDSFVTVDNFLTLKYSLIQRESKQDVDDLQLFNHEKLQVNWIYYQKKSDGSIKKKNELQYIPALSIDPFSVLFFYQGLPLKVGDKYEVPLINKGKIVFLKSQVEATEKIKLKKKEYRAIRVQAQTKYKGEHLKSGNLIFWFSDDDKRELLRVKAKIKIGSVTADMLEP